MAGMIEVRAEDIPRLLQETEGPFVLYLYSPLCGTCSLASQMLNIVIQTSASLLSSNVMYCLHLIYARIGILKLFLALFFAAGIKQAIE
ncbi:hypothetical protein M5W68_20120 [Paenibacillus larvae]|uniref:hypothetical protein n=1 Tax=Paenibacillus larvae TaxID=1464 RepID=UPI0022801A25|nr:hypothetical protein [Paenibacillus larvae]MCY9509136.1 hypothetical protein [Paenibacillus larvae]MCY9527345.1 hypothetical protein [Paenibacillus larvae]